MLDPTEGRGFHGTSPAGAGEIDVDLLAIDLDQGDVTVIALQHRADRLKSLFNLADALVIGQFRLAGRLGRSHPGLGRLRLVGIEAAVDRDQDILDLLVTGRAAATGFRIVGHLFEGPEAVGTNGILDHHDVDRKTLADQIAVFVIVFPYLATIVGDRRLQRLASHHRTVHLFRRQTVEIVGDVLVADLQGLVERLALDDLGQGRRRGDRRAAAEGLEARVIDDFRFGVDLQHQAQRVAALDGTEVADTVGVFQRSRVPRVEEVFAHLLGVVPHDDLLSR